MCQSYSAVKIKTESSNDEMKVYKKMNHEEDSLQSKDERDGRTQKSHSTYGALLSNGDGDVSNHRARHRRNKKDTRGCFDKYLNNMIIIYMNMIFKHTLYLYPNQYTTCNK